MKSNQNFTKLYLPWKAKYTKIVCVLHEQNLRLFSQNPKSNVRPTHRHNYNK